MRKAGGRHVIKAEGDLGAQARYWLRTLNRETVEHPLRTVGIVAGAGFVLGGGLFTPLTFRTLRSGIHLALRLGVLPALTRGLALMGARLIEDLEGYGSTTIAEGEKS
jgi:hypothetical protein